MRMEIAWPKGAKMPSNLKGSVVSVGAVPSGLVVKVHPKRRTVEVEVAVAESGTDDSDVR